jgi:hypothetical protein
METVAPSSLSGATNISVVSQSFIFERNTRRDAYGVLRVTHAVKQVAPPVLNALRQELVKQLTPHVAEDLFPFGAGKAAPARRSSAWLVGRGARTWAAIPTIHPSAGPTIGLG